MTLREKRRRAALKGWETRRFRAHMADATAEIFKSAEPLTQDEMDAVRKFFVGLIQIARKQSPAKEEPK